MSAKIWVLFQSDEEQGNFFTFNKKKIFENRWEEVYEQLTDGYDIDELTLELIEESLTEERAAKWFEENYREETQCFTMKDERAGNKKVRSVFTIVKKGEFFDPMFWYQKKNAEKYLKDELDNSQEYRVVERKLDIQMDTHF